MSVVGKILIDFLKTTRNKIFSNSIDDYTESQFEESYSEAEIVIELGDFGLYKFKNYFDCIFKPKKNFENYVDYRIFSIFRFIGDSSSICLDLFKHYVNIVGVIYYFETSTELKKLINWLEKITTIARQNLHHSAAHVAVLMNLVDIYDHKNLIEFINYKAEDSGLCPLGLAIKEKNIKVSMSLLNSPSIDISLRDINGNSLIHLAAQYKQYDILKAILQSCSSENIINDSCHSLNQRVCCNSFNKYGQTPFYLSVKNGDKNICELLILYGADARLSKADFCPLHIAVESEEFAIVDTILKSFPTAINIESNITKVKPFAMAKSNSMITKLIEYGADIDSQDSNGRTQLHHKVLLKDFDMVLLLLLKLGNPNIKDKNGALPLHLACEASENQLCVEIIQALLVFESNINEKDNNGASPRHRLCCASNQKYVSNKIKDLALFTMHAVGAKRCEPVLKDCTRGCISESQAQNLEKQPDQHKMTNTSQPSFWETVLKQTGFSENGDETNQLFNGCPPIQIYSEETNSNADDETSFIESKKVKKRFSIHKSMSMNNQKRENLSKTNLSEIPLSDEKGVDKDENDTFSTNEDNDMEERIQTIADQPVELTEDEISCSCKFIDELNNRFDTSLRTNDHKSKGYQDLKGNYWSRKFPQCSALEGEECCQEKYSRLINKGARINETKAPMERDDKAKNPFEEFLKCDEEFEEKVKKRPLRLLSLDGGGIRGLMLIQTLIAIEKQLDKPLRDVFDWTMGSSTGCVLALYLAKGKCLRYIRSSYFDFAEKIFSTDKRPYDTLNLEKYVRNEFGDNNKMIDLKCMRVAGTSLLSDRFPPSLHLFRNYYPSKKTLDYLMMLDESIENEDHMNKLIKNIRMKYDIFISESDEDEVECFEKRETSKDNKFKDEKKNSYSSPFASFLASIPTFEYPDTTNSTFENQDGQDLIVPAEYNDQYIWHVARASGAAPTYFRACGGYLDGGLISNNPAIDLLTEVHENNLVREICNKDQYKIGVIVSLGCGKIPISKQTDYDVFIPNNPLEIIKSARGISMLGRILVEMATMSEGRIVERTRAWCNSLCIPYFRFSPLISVEYPLNCHEPKEMIRMMWENMIYIHKCRHRILKLGTYLNV